MVAAVWFFSLPKDPVQNALADTFSDGLSENVFGSAQGGLQFVSDVLPFLNIANDLINGNIEGAIGYAIGFEVGGPIGGADLGCQPVVAT